MQSVYSAAPADCASHQGTYCDYKLCEEGSDIFDNLEATLSYEMKIAILIINLVNMKLIFIMKRMEDILF